ncbi:MAG: insulinase family protein, partial [Blastocatellia bacterium]|nr:insulinase family protein [Blastocatellia bacterium]
GYHIPATNHPDYYPLSVLQNILFSGESSRVYKRLVNKDQLVISVFGSSDLAFDPTLFYITMQVKPDVAPEAAEKALYEELEKVAKGDIKEEELQKAKNSLLVTFYSYFKTIASKANAIGNAEVFFGDYKKLLSTPEDFNRVKLEDLQRVANKYFKPRNRTVVTLVPTPEEKEEKPQVTENRGAAE